MAKKNTTPYVSIIIPLFNEEESLNELYSQIKNAMNEYKKSYEIIFIDDGSTDNSFKVLKELYNKHKDIIRVIRFRRNFGKAAALSVGFKESKGSFVITMDADLQDDPKEIPSLIEALGDSYDLVTGWKKKRFDPLSKKIPSKIANYVTAKLTGIKVHDMNCGLKAYRNDVVKNLTIHGELHRYIPALTHWVGFRVSEKPVQHHPRKFGKTKYGFARFLRSFLDLLTVIFTTRYIRRPLHLFGVWGLISLFIGASIDIYLSIEWFLGLTALSNRPLFIVGVLFIIVGIQFISLGLLGEMISRQENDEDTYSIREKLD